MMQESHDWEYTLQKTLIKKYTCYTHTVLKWITKRTSCVAHGTYSVVCSQCHGPGWWGVWGRMDTGVCMAESLHGSPETTTTSYVNWLSPNIK